MLNKILSIILAVSILLGQGGVGSYVYAEAQPAQEATEASEATPADEATEPTPEPTPEANTNVQTETNTTTDTPEGTVADGNVGDTTVNTGNATSEGNILNNTNTNASGANCCTGGTGSVTNSGNGSGSDNNSSATVNSNNNNNQNNSATISNGLTGAAISGENSTSKNVGNSSLTTGDANSTGTIITAANTNIEGLAISEFNIVDDHNGDYILDFAAGCIVGCEAFNLANTGNGSDSSNNASATLNSNNNTNQTNDGTVVNNLDLIANSGDNHASRNTGGDSTITTGDANVEANVLTFLNNNLAGNVVFGVVNIFGDLIGDIILPSNIFDSIFCSTCGGSTNIANTGNGSGSDNNAAYNQNLSDTINQANLANIDNNLWIEAQTGGNTTNSNTGGSSSITTGSSTVDANLLNIANMNLIGGNMWLVIVNEGGKWIGRLLGAPEGSNFAASSLADISVDEFGAITVGNTGNGAGSTNNATNNSNVNNTTNQTNTANIENNINLYANTGGNHADRNTGGDSSITTGDAQVIANIVNFVNNNIKGGKLLVTFVNVFGSWTGDFITPGNEKQKTVSESSSNTNNSSSGGSSVSVTSKVAGASSENNRLTAAAGFFNSGFQNIVGGATNDDSDEKLVASAKSTPLGAVADDAQKAISVNLAWVLLLMPVFASMILLRKIMNLRRAKVTRGITL